MMNKKEKAKILNSLMGFYQISCGLFESLTSVQDDMLKGVLLKEHLFQLLAYHKEFTDKYSISIPEIDETYKLYCDEYGNKMEKLSELFKATVNEYKKKDDSLGYIT